MADAQLRIDINASAAGALPAFQQTQAAVAKTEQTFQVFNNTLNQSVGFTKQLANADADAAAAAKQFCRFSKRSVANAATVSNIFHSGSRILAGHSHKIELF